MRPVDATGVRDLCGKRFIPFRNTRSSRWKSGKAFQVERETRFREGTSFLKRGCGIQDNWKSAAEPFSPAPGFPRLQQGAETGL